MEFHDNEKHNRFCKVRVSDRMCHAQAGIWIVEILLLLGKFFPFEFMINYEPSQNRYLPVSTLLTVALLFGTRVSRGP